MNEGLNCVCVELTSRGYSVSVSYQRGRINLYVNMDPLGINDRYLDGVNRTFAAHTTVEDLIHNLREMAAIIDAEASLAAKA